MKLAEVGRLVWLGSVVLTPLLQACSGGDDQDDGASPTEKCSAVMSKTCSYFVNCGKATQTECEQAVRQTTHCDKAKAVSSTYEQCMTQLDSWSCTADDLPPSCQGAVLE